MNWKWPLSLVAIAAAAAGAYVYFGPGPLLAMRQETVRENDKARAEVVLPPAITVARVGYHNFVETVSVSGSLVARDEVLVSPEIDGFRVLELLVDEGDRVEAGQVMARLVTIQLDAQAAQNDASKVRSDAAIAQARSQITEVEARLAEAKKSLERAEPLKKSGYLSESTYDQRQSAARSLAAQLISARDGLKVAEADRARVEAERSELNWRRGNTLVKAPETGIVSRRNGRVGAMATGTGEPMFRIIARGEIELDAEIVETELAKVEVGQKARITVPGTGDVTGTVRLVPREIDKTTRLGRIKVFIGAERGLRIGAYARGLIETAEARGLAIPSSAALFESAGTYVQVVNGDKVEKRLVKTGLQAEGATEIVEGLKEGDLVVARSGTFLRDGDIIRPIETTKAEASKTVSEVR